MKNAQLSARVILFVLLAVTLESASLCAQAGSMSPTPDTPQHRYRFVEIPTLGGPQSYTNFTGAANRLLNSRGLVGGEADTSAVDPFCFGNPDCLVQRAFLWSDGALTELPSLPGGQGTQVFWLNESGDGTGVSLTGGIDSLLLSTPPPWGVQEFHAVVWKNGQVVDLGTLGGALSFGQAINDRGQAVGIALNDVPDDVSIFGFYMGTQMRAFLWERGVMRDLGTLGGTNAWAMFVNESGQVAGISFTDRNINPTTNSPTTHPFLWEKGKMTDLGSLGGTYGWTNGLNRRGDVVGWMNLAGDNTAHPFLWHKGTLEDLGTLGGTLGIAYAINEAGEVVGYTTTANDIGALGFKWERGTMTELPPLLGDDCSFASGVNSRGQTVGASFGCVQDSGPFRAALWDEDGPIDLNAYVPTSSTLYLPGFDIYINDHGVIYGTGFTPDGNSRAFVLTPCDDEPQAEGCFAGHENPSPSPVSQTAVSARTQTKFDAKNAPASLRSRLPLRQSLSHAATTPR